MQPFFSIIIPLFNKENYIVDTLNSIKQQTFTNYEVIIVNDGSTDSSYEITKDFINENKINAKIFNQENKGLASTRNKGINIAEGQIIALLDADDTWEKQYLEEIHFLYLNFPQASFYGTDYLEYYSEKKTCITKKNIPQKLKNQRFIVEDFFLFNLHQNIICQSSIAFKKRVYNSLNIEFDSAINYAEDIDFYIKVFYRENLAYSWKPLSKIRLDQPDQMTSIGIRNKKIVNLDKFEKLSLNNKNLKRYLDFYRYVFATQYKQMGDTKNFKAQLNHLNFDNLNWKQQLLLKCPKQLSSRLYYLKKLLLRKNIKWNTYLF